LFFISHNTTPRRIPQLLWRTAGPFMEIRARIGRTFDQTEGKSTEDKMLTKRNPYRSFASARRDSIAVSDVALASL